MEGLPLRPAPKGWLLASPGEGRPVRGTAERRDGKDGYAVPGSRG